MICSGARGSLQASDRLYATVATAGVNEVFISQASTSM